MAATHTDVAAGSHADPVGRPRRGPVDVRSQRLARLVVPVLVVLAATAYLTIAVLFLAPGPPDSDVPELIFLAAHLFTVCVGGLVARRRPRLALGWLLLATGGLVLLSAALDAYAHRALLGDATLPGGIAARWAQGWLYTLGWSIGGCLVLLFLPDGRLPSRRWRPVAALGGGIVVLSTLSTALRAGPIGETLPVTNPTGVSVLTPILEVVDVVGSLGAALMLLTGVVSLVVRWRRSGPRVRRQIGWLLLAVVVLAGLMVMAGGVSAAGAPDAVSAVLVAVALAALPAGIAVAILRENLLDIRVALSRTLILAVISGISLVVYALAVTLASRSFGAQADVAASLLATLLVALLLGSVRSRAESWLQRQLFGDASPPAGGSELTDIVARHQDPSRVLHELAGQVRDLLGAPYVAIESRAGRTASGRAAAGTTYALVHQGHEVGWLTVGTSPAAGPAAWPAARVPIAELTTHLGAALWSLHLADELQRTRRQLVQGREQERLRVRRDLHDGIGPVLASVTLQLDSLRRRMDAEDTEGRRIAEEAKDDVRRALGDLRSLVEGLRPPALDQLGLVRAVERHVQGLSGSGVDITVDLHGAQQVGPATEVAAFRVVSEALTNVVRHADAAVARVELAEEPDGWLRVAVSDDGVGITGTATGGVGLSSMSERAAELGGTFAITSRPGGGTVVTARFPPEV